jgi:hypothetical protein
MGRIRMLVVLMALCAVACSKEPSRWEAAEQKAEQAVAARTEDAPEKTAGSALNGFFPARGPNGESRVFTAEKAGYAEAKLNGPDGAEVALLAIAEAAPDAIGKFEGASEQVAGHPLVTVGKNQSSVLVNKRFQVKVSSKTLAADARKALLGSFDLAGLAKR